jgi:hypothetical protein
VISTGASRACRRAWCAIGAPPEDRFGHGRWCRPEATHGDVGVRATGGGCMLGHFLGYPLLSFQWSIGAMAVEVMCTIEYSAAH